MYIRFADMLYTSESDNIDYPGKFILYGLKLYGQ